MSGINSHLGHEWNTGTYEYELRNVIEDARRRYRKDLTPSNPSATLKEIGGTDDKRSRSDATAHGEERTDAGGVVETPRDDTAPDKQVDERKA